MHGAIMRVTFPSAGALDRDGGMEKRYLNIYTFTYTQN
jgi:hypothetical protein